MSGTIKLTIAVKEYERLLNRELKMMYQLYPVAVEHDYCVLSTDVFYSPEFRRTRKI